MSVVSDKKLREAKRQERQLTSLMEAAKELPEASLLRLYLYIDDLLGTDAETSPSVETEVESEVHEPHKREDRTTTKPRVKKSGHGDYRSYTDQTEALIVGLGSKKGMTSMEVSQATGQKRGSADGTLRYIANDRKTIEKSNDGKWYAVANGKRPPSGPKMGAREQIVAAYEGNANAPWATRDIAAALPDVKRGTLDKTLVGMRADGILISCGSDPNGSGGLYKLANPQGGARAGLI